MCVWQCLVTEQNLALMVMELRAPAFSVAAPVAGRRTKTSVVSEGAGLRVSGDASMWDVAAGGDHTGGAVRVLYFTGDR